MDFFSLKLLFLGKLLTQLVFLVRCFVIALSQLTVLIIYCCTLELFSPLCCIFLARSDLGWSCQISYSCHASVRYNITEDVLKCYCFTKLFSSFEGKNHSLYKGSGSSLESQQCWNRSPNVTCKNILLLRS